MSKVKLVNKKVVAVVVTYNRVALLKECIDALLKQKELSGIVIVNNNSTDGTKEYLDELVTKRLHVNIHPLTVDYNSGGAGGFHYGLNEACKYDYDYVWIMDDDAIPQEQSLTPLVKSAKSLDDKFGFLTSNVKDPSGVCMNTPSIDGRLNEADYPDWAKYSHLGLIKVSLATFVSVFIKVDTVKDVGLPIKEMFIWGDDSEYTQRISNKHDSYFVTDSYVIHKRVSGKSLNIIYEENENRLDWYKLSYRNNGYRIRKHEGIKNIIKFYLSSFIVFAKIITKSSNLKVKRVKLLLEGLFSSCRFNPEIKYPNK